MTFYDYQLCQKNKKIKKIRNTNKDHLLIRTMIPYLNLIPTDNIDSKIHEYFFYYPAPCTENTLIQFPLSHQKLSFSQIGFRNFDFLFVSTEEWSTMVGGKMFGFLRTYLLIAKVLNECYYLFTMKQERIARNDKVMNYVCYH